MCTAATYKTNDFYMGRTLDYEFSYGDEITVTPRNYSFTLRHGGKLENHYAIIGMAHVAGNYPLYYDAINEKGLGIAGLNFVGNATYKPVDPSSSKHQITQFELIPFILGTCASLKEAKEALKNMDLVDTPFSPQLPVGSLHWLIADETGSITVEAVKEGLMIYDNPAGVLTNNPPFPQQMFQLNNYMHLSPRQPVNTFSNDLPLNTYSRGMGALGLPGDLSSSSRFVRASYVKMNSRCNGDELSSVSQFFHILGSVDQQRGCCEVAEGKYEITLYTSCCNCDKGIYYYTTYENHQISAVHMHHEDLDGTVPVRYPVLQGEKICLQN